MSHPSSLHLDILSVHSVDSHHVIAEVKGLKSLLLAQQSHDSAASPLQPLPTPLPVGTHTHREQCNYPVL